MKIFISWSDERSEALAKALREWFPLVLHFVQPWLSKSDILAGERWSVEIAKELESCNFGVICITRGNLNAPWILFEAGALAKSMQDGRVIPLLLDLDFKEISGPLAQFQAKKADIGGIKELVVSLNQAASSPVPESQLEKLFLALWGDLEKQIVSIPKGATPAKQIRPQGEILEELVSNIRGVELRVRDAMDHDLEFRRRKRGRFNVGLIREIIARVQENPADPVHILIIASLVRDDVPWFYEIALETYRALRSGARGGGRKEIKRLFAAFEVLIRGPFAEEFGLDRQVLRFLRENFYELFEVMKFDLENRGPTAPDLSKRSEFDNIK